MSTRKRAFLYVTRRRGRTLLLFLILLLTATFVLAGLSIWRAARDAQLHLRQSLGGQFDIFVDWDNSPYVVCETIVDNEVDEETGKISTSYLMYSTVQLTPEQIAAIRQLPGVTSVSARLEDLAPVDELSLFPGTVSTDVKNQGRTKLFGVCGTADDLLFTDGTLTLTEGRHIASDDRHVALISRELAENSGLSVGDTITVHRYDAEAQDYTGAAIRLEIVGLFSGAAEPFGTTVTTYDRILNHVFLDFQTSVEIDGGSFIHGFSAAHITVEDPQETGQVISTVNALPGIDWDGFLIETGNDTYERAAAPLSALSRLTAALLAVMIAAASVILSLILTLWTKSRVHETGVLLSVGIRKSAILAQYLTEALLIAVLAFGLSYVTGSAVAEQTGRYLLAHQLQTAPDGETDDGAVSFEAGADGLAPEPQPDETGIRITVGPERFAWLCLIGTAIITLSVSVASITVMRMKPREILSEMS